MLVVFVDQQGNDSVDFRRPPDLRSSLEVLLDLFSATWPSVDQSQRTGISREGQVRNNRIAQFCYRNVHKNKYIVESLLV